MTRGESIAAKRDDIPKGEALRLLRNHLGEDVTVHRRSKKQVESIRWTKNAPRVINVAGSWRELVEKGQRRKRRVS